MRYFLALFLPVAACFVASAQNEKKDSLLNRLKSHQQEDSAKVDILTWLSYYSFDSPDDTRKYAEDAIALADKIHYRKGSGTGHYDLAIYYLEVAEFDKALEEALASVKIFESVPYVRGVYNSYSQIANVYMHWKDYDKALNYFNKMLALDSIHKKLGDQGILYNNMGSIHGKKKDFEKAIYYHQLTLDLWTKRNYRYGIAVATCELGQSMVELKRYKEAEIKFRKSIQIIEEIKAGQNVAAMAHLGLAETEAAAKHFTESEIELNKAIAMAKADQDRTALLEMYLKASSIYEMKGDYKKALQFKELEKTMSDSIFNAEKAKQVAQAGTAYETEKKDESIKTLEGQKKEQAAQLTFLQYILVVTAVVFSAAFFVIYQKRKRERQLLANLAQEYEKIKNYKPRNGNTKMSISPSPITLASADERFLQNAIGAVERNMSNTIFGVDNLADELAVSRTQLHRKLKELAGLSTGEFIRYLRLKRAAMLLEKKTDSITQIAYEVGFNDQSYFTKAFKKQFGKTPSEYTQLHEFAGTN